MPRSWTVLLSQAQTSHPPQFVRFHASHDEGARGACQRATGYTSRGASVLSFPSHGRKDLWGACAQFYHARDGSIVSFLEYVCVQTTIHRVDGKGPRRCAFVP